MLAASFRNQLWEAKYTAMVYQRYYQLKREQMWWWDKAVKIGVAVLAVLALLAVFLPHDPVWKGIEIVAASLALVAAIVLNVIPVGEWEAAYGEMFRGWTDLLVGTEQLELKAWDLADDADVPDHRVDRLAELVARQYQLEGDGPTPKDELLLVCQRYINESVYGTGLQNYNQVVGALNASAVAAAAPVAAVAPVGQLADSSAAG